MESSDATKIAQFLPLIDLKKSSQRNEWNWGLEKRHS